MGIYDRGYYRDDEWKNADGDPRVGKRPQSVVTTLIIVNVAIFLVDMFSGASPLGGGNLRLSTMLALKSGTAEVAPGPLDSPLYLWQLVSYGFAHASITSDRGILHVAFNMILLFFFGRPIEERYGSAEFARFYFVTLILAGVVWLLLAWLLGRTAHVVGASGAVTGVVMLFVFNYPRQTVHLLGVIAIPAWLMGALLVVTDMLTSLNAASGVAAETHLTGAAFAAAWYYGKWNLRFLKFSWLGRIVGRRPNLKIHQPGSADEATLSGEADRVLEKLHRDGEESLTRRERRILEKYSREVRGRRGQ